MSFTLLTSAMYTSRIPTRKMPSSRFTRGMEKLLWKLISRTISAGRNTKSPMERARPSTTATPMISFWAFSSLKCASIH